MQVISRIPILQEKTFVAAQQWFAKMQQAQMLFHPDDDPQKIVSIVTSAPVFTGTEVIAVRAIMAQLFDCLGSDVYDACYAAVIDCRQAG